MGAMLTGRVKIEQTSRTRIYSLLENLLFLDDDGTFLLVPRTFCSDGYTIPLWIDALVGGGFDCDLRPALLHDLACSTRNVIGVNLTLDDLCEKGLLKFEDSKGCWVCKDIPEEYLFVKKVSKKQANDLIWRAMGAVPFPIIKRIVIRIGVCFNIGWYISYWLKQVKEVNLSEIYDPCFWNFIKGK